MEVLIMVGGLIGVALIFSFAHSRINPPKDRLPTLSKRPQPTRHHPLTGLKNHDLIPGRMAINGAGDWILVSDDGKTIWHYFHDETKWVPYDLLFGGYLVRREE